jgi:TonB family protein
MIALVAALALALQDPACADSALIAAAVPSARLDQPLQPMRRPPMPDYPPELAANPRPGRVVFDLLVLPSGRIDRCSVKVVSATDRAFIAPARRSVIEVAFAPPVAGGRVVPARTSVTIGFRVNLKPAAPPIAPAPDSSHGHMTTCDDLPEGSPRPAYGCFNIAVARALRFDGREAYWYLQKAGSRAEADSARTGTGVVVETDGEWWVTAFGETAAPPGPPPTAVVGPLALPSAGQYDAVISYAVMRPGDRSVVHRHPGPEGWYLLAGEQCLETPRGGGEGGSGIHHDRRGGYADAALGQRDRRTACARAGHPQR